MEIPYAKIAFLLAEAYDIGYRGCQELKKEAIEELLRDNQIRNTEEFRIWSVAELRKMPEGTIFQHIIRGRCWISNRSNGVPFVQFQRGSPVELSSDSDPWDKPMRLIQHPTVE